MRVCHVVIVVLAILMLVSPVKAEELLLNITLKEFSDINKDSLIAQDKRNHTDLAFMINKSNTGKVVFSQSLNVTDTGTMDETVVIDDKTVEFHCQMGKLEEDKLTAVLTFSMSAAYGEHKIIRQLYCTSTTLQLRLGEKSYIAGLSNNNSVRLFIVQLTKKR